MGLVSYHNLKREEAFLLSVSSKMNPSSSEVIRDIFIASVDVTRCFVPNADFILPVTRDQQATQAPEGESSKTTRARIDHLVHARLSSSTKYVSQQ